MPGPVERVKQAGDRDDPRAGHLMWRRHAARLMRMCDNLQAADLKRSIERTLRLAGEVQQRHLPPAPEKSPPAMIARPCDVAPSSGRKRSPLRAGLRAKVVCVLVIPYMHIKSEDGSEGYYENGTRYGERANH